MTQAINSGSSPVRSGAWATLQQFSNLAYTGVLVVVAARLLSVADFGALNYALTTAALAVSISSAGFYGLAVREYSNHPERTALITSTIVAIRETVAMVCYAALLVVAGATTDGLLWPVAIAGAAVFARSFDVIELWYVSKLEARTPARLKIITGVFFLTLKVIVLLVAPSVTAVLVVYLVEQVAYVWILGWLYNRRNPSNAWRRPQHSTTRDLAKQGAPLLVSSIANQINLRVDVIIIQAILGSAAVGVYSAAARVGEIAYVLPVVFMNATFPALLATKRESSHAYRDALQRSFDGSIWFGILVAAGIIALAPIAVPLLFGEEFAAAVRLLQIMALACPAIFMGAVVSKWIVAENRLWLSLWRHVAGALLNVGLTVALVPTYGLPAAAWATVASYTVANCVFLFFGRATRPLGVLAFKATWAPIRMVRAGIASRNERK